jgi:hypothetical protein
LTARTRVSWDFHRRNSAAEIGGGGGKYGPAHLWFDPTDHAPFADLFISIARRLGIGIERFAYATHRNPA